LDPYSFFDSRSRSGYGSSILGLIPIESGSDLDPIRIQPGSRVWITENWKKFTADKKNIFFYIKHCNLPIPRPPQATEEAFSPQKRTSSTPKHEIS
jgi:hypothetical protein